MEVGIDQDALRFFGRYFFSWRALILDGAAKHRRGVQGNGLAI